MAALLTPEFLRQSDQLIAVRRAPWLRQRPLTIGPVVALKTRLEQVP